MHKSVMHNTLVPGVEVISIMSDRTFPRHSHDEFGIGYIVDGAQSSWSGRGHVNSKSGDIITVNPGEIHDGIGRKDCPRHWKMLFLTPDAIERIAGRPSAQIELHDPVLRDNKRQAIVARAISELISGNSDQGNIEEKLLLAIRCIIDPASQAHLKKGCSWAVEQVIRKIEADYAMPINLSHLAATAQMSRYQTLRHFSAEIGTTPHAYLMQYRVKQARRFIRSGRSLADTANTTGFADQSHMTRSFVRLVGVTPGRYLRAHTA